MRAETINPEDWMNQGKCFGIARASGSYDLFFEEENIGRAKKICKDCPVKVKCLEYALEHNMKTGVWGGFSDAMRKRLKARMNKNGTTLEEELAQPKRR